MNTGKSPLSKTRKEKLRAALESLDSDKVLTLTELEGFLHALVITPDMVMPSEWLPGVFGEETPEFETEEHQQQVFSAIFDAYRAYEKARTANKLRFPFKLISFSRDMLYEIQQWCYGFMEALVLRPEIWFLNALEGELNFDDLPEMEQAVALSVSTIGAVAYPGDFIKALLETETINGNEKEIFAALSEEITNVPFAVEILQLYGNTLWQEKLQQMRGGVFDFNTKKKKIGRNDPCPCGSGKKYKKCCGRN